MKCLCLIPARGGSKRIPRKNIKDFCGKPIVAYAIETALKSGIFDEVMVSTDDEEIAEVAKKYGASVPFFRSAETANDYATTEAVLKEVLAEYEKRGKTFDIMCNIYPCTPLVTVERLHECLQKLLDTGADCCQSMVRFSVPPQQALKNENGFLSFLQPEYAYERTQDLEPLYYDAGQFYFYDLKTYHQLDATQRKNAMIELTELESQDVDTLVDWQIAEIKYKLLHGQKVE